MSDLPPVRMRGFLIVELEHTSRPALALNDVALLDVIVIELLLSSESKESIRESVLFCFGVGRKAKILFPI